MRSRISKFAPSLLFSVHSSKRSKSIPISELLHGLHRGCTSIPKLRARKMIMPTNLPGRNPRLFNRETCYQCQTVPLSTPKLATFGEPYLGGGEEVLEVSTTRLGSGSENPPEGTRLLG